MILQIDTDIPDQIFSFPDISDEEAISLIEQVFSLIEHEDARKEVKEYINNFIY